MLARLIVRFAPWLCRRRAYAAGVVAGYTGWIEAPLLGTVAFTTSDPAEIHFV